MQILDNNETATGIMSDSQVKLAANRLDNILTLDQLTFAVKDVFDVKTLVTGCGNLAWLRGREVASQHAKSVEVLLAAGAQYRGKTICDEMAFSLDGENQHYGTPINPKAPEHIPGGSSSGSAVAVASGAVDFALGTDTAGSVRIPAAFCGVYGIRTSHGRISIDGIHPLAPSLDTVGWFARDAKTLANVGKVYWPASQKMIEPKPVTTLFSVTNFYQPLQGVVKQQYQALWHRLHNRGIAVETIALPINELKLYSQVLKQLQWWQLRQIHGDWINRNLSSFAEEIGSRLAQLPSIDHHQYEIALEQQQQLRALLSKFLQEYIGIDGIMLMPTAPMAAPKLGRNIAQVRQCRAQLIEYTALASLMGWPQLSMPLNSGQGHLPLGLSLLAQDGQDERLLSCAMWMSDSTD